MNALWQNANYRRLWISQMGVAVGDAFMRMGLLELFRAHGFNKERELARAMFVVAVPGVLLGPVAMAVIDRWQRRRVLWVNDLLRAGAVMAIAVWLWPLLAGRVNEAQLFVVYGLIFAIGCFATFYLPARSALVPHLVPPEQLAQANTLFASSLAVATIAGQAAGGWVARRVRMASSSSRAIFSGHHWAPAATMPARSSGCSPVGAATVIVAWRASRSMSTRTVS